MCETRTSQVATSGKIFMPDILTQPKLKGHLMLVKCEQPLDELTVQLWLLYHNPNFKYCTWVERNYVLKNGQTDIRTIHTRYPPWTFQPGGIKLHNTPPPNNNNKQNNIWGKCSFLYHPAEDNDNVCNLNVWTTNPKTEKKFYSSNLKFVRRHWVVRVKFHWNPCIGEVKIVLRKDQSSQTAKNWQRVLQEYLLPIKSRQNQRSWKYLS